jgi:hypothetical protein
MNFEIDLFISNSFYIITIKEVGTLSLEIAYNKNNLNISFISTMQDHDLSWKDYKFIL